jgi:hypothetical protein
MAERAPLNILLVIVAAVPLVVTVVDFLLAQGNHSLRSEVNQRQHLINQGAQLAHVNQALIRQIAVVAVRDRDSRLRELLSRNGITVNIAPGAPGAPADEGKGG